MKIMHKKGTEFGAACLYCLSGVGPNSFFQDLAIKADGPALGALSIVRGVLTRTSFPFPFSFSPSLSLSSGEVYEP